MSPDYVFAGVCHVTERACAVVIIILNYNANYSACACSVKLRMYDCYVCVVKVSLLCFYFNLYFMQISIEINVNNSSMKKLQKGMNICV